MMGPYDYKVRLGFCDTCRQPMIMVNGKSQTAVVVEGLQPDTTMTPHCEDCPALAEVSRNQGQA